MFIDYITLMLINMVAGLVVLAAFLVWGLEKKDISSWAPAFAIIGIVAIGFGTHMTLTWPIPGAYNMAFGEMTVLFGILYIGAALAAWRKLTMTAVTIYAFFAGLAAIVIGAQIINLGMTLSPLIAGFGFILTGAAGVFAYPIYRFCASRSIRTLCAIALCIAAAIWSLIGYGAYWQHMESLKDWKPVTMQVK